MTVTAAENQYKQSDTVVNLPPARYKKWHHCIDTLISIFFKASDKQRGLQNVLSKSIIFIIQHEIWLQLNIRCEDQTTQFVFKKMLNFLITGQQLIEIFYGYENVHAFD